ncbi:hypothetical protein GGR52DRAFT_558281 [Hypoxylon sp. FL1284]|nr:hypothetical protein GGR52DRAFT_558281 [Hypoxylon sp. FL1284]
MYENGDLYKAAFGNDIKQLKDLINKNADVNAQGGQYGNALQAASYEGHLEIVKFLVEKGADVNAQGGEYGNALCAASIATRVQTMIYLLKHKAQPGLRDSLKRTALHHAVKASSFVSTNLLLNHQVSPEDKDLANISPFDIAVRSRNNTLIVLLLSYAKKMPQLSADDWRACLNWAPDSHISFHTSLPHSIQRHSTALRQLLMDESFPITTAQTIPWKESSRIGSMSTEIVYILATGDLLQHIPGSKLHCRWWRKCRREEPRGGIFRNLAQSRDLSWVWSVQSDTFPDSAACRHLRQGEDFVEIGFRVTCLKVTHQNWRNLQSDRGNGTMFCDEGFLCIQAPHRESPDQGHTSLSILRPIYLISTANNSPILLATDGEGLLKPLISKIKCLLQENCDVASRQLSESRSQVVQHSGDNPRLLSRLLYDAQILERIAENHKNLVGDLNSLVQSLSAFHDPWKLSEDSLKKVMTKVNELSQLDRTVHELEEKLQSIIQLEFNLSSILEAQRSTSTNRSLKRLSWITFAFLPLLFISSLFGMNVDILAGNPSWWWYFPLAGACLLLCMAVLVCFKRFNTLEGRLERHFSWLIGGEKQVDEEQAFVALETKRERTSQYSLYGKKRS